MKKQHRGFAAMKDKEKQREIARAGGIAAHAAGMAHTFTKKEAAAAGKKGGNARAALYKNKKSS